MFPSLVNKIFEIKATTGWHFDAAIQGISVGLLTTLLFTLPPLVAIRKIRPAMILRRGMADQKLPLRGRIAAAREAVVLGAIILLGLGGIAGWLGGSARVGGYFAGGLFFSLIALAAVAALLLRALRVFLRRSPVRLPSLVRQGFANLYRQGNQAQPILVAMGLGVMFTLSVYLIQNSLIDEIIQTAPPGVPNVYLVGVTLDQSTPLKQLISSQPGILTAPQLSPSVSARLVRIDGEDVASRPMKGFARRYLNTRSVTWENDQPDNISVAAGKWWKRNETEPVVSVEEDTAKTLDIRPGSSIEMDVSRPHDQSSGSGGAPLRGGPPRSFGFRFRRIRSGGAAGRVLRRRAYPALRGWTAPARHFRKISDRDCGECRRRASDRSADHRSDRAGDPVPFGVRDPGGSHHPRRERRGKPFPPHPRSRDPEDSRRDPSPYCASLFD